MNIGDLYETDLTGSTGGLPGQCILLKKLQAKICPEALAHIFQKVVKLLAGLLYISRLMHINTGRIFSFIWKYLNTIFIGPYHIDSIADGNAFQSGLGTIQVSVAVQVEINGPPAWK